MKGELETILRGERSEASGEASGGPGGACVRAGEWRGGREGGVSSRGEADFTVFTEVVEERESEEDVTDSLLGESGERLRPLPSCEKDSFSLLLQVVTLAGFRG